MKCSIFRTQFLIFHLFLLLVFSVTYHILTLIFKFFSLPTLLSFILPYLVLLYFTLLSITLLYFTLHHSILLYITYFTFTFCTLGGERKMKLFRESLRSCRYWRKNRDRKRLVGLISITLSIFYHTITFGFLLCPMTAICNVFMLKL